MLKPPISISSSGAVARVHAALREIGRQVGGDEDELQAADEEGQRHHHIAVMAPRLVQRTHQGEVAVGDPLLGSLSARLPMKAAGSMASGQDREGPQAGAPALVVEQVGRDRRGRTWCRPSPRPRRCRRPGCARCGATTRGGDVGGDARGRAGERHADQHAGAQHDRPVRWRGRGQHDADDVDQAADQRHPAGAVLVGQDAGERLAAGPRRPAAPRWRARSRRWRCRVPWRPAPGTGRGSAGCPWPGSSSAPPRPAWRRPGRARPGERGRNCSWRRKIGNVLLCDQ